MNGSFKLGQLLVQFIRLAWESWASGFRLIVHLQWQDGGGVTGVGGGGALSRGVKVQVGFGQFQVQEVLAAGQVQGAGLGELALALFEQVGDVLATEGLELQRVLKWPGRYVGPVDLAEGHDLADVLEDIEPAFGQALVKGFGLGGQGQQLLEELLLAAPAACWSRPGDDRDSRMSWWRS